MHPMSTATVSFFCSRCKKPYSWLPEYAGKVVQCTCGGIMQFPFNDPNPRDPLAIAFLRTELPDDPTRALSPNEVARPAYEPEGPIQLDLHGITMNPSENVVKEEFRNSHVPFGLLILALFMLGWSIAAKSAPLLTTLILVGITVAVELGLMLLGLMLAGKFMNIDFGTPKSAMFKLSALYLGPSGLTMLAANSFGEEAVMMLIYGAVSLVLYWILLAYLFRLTAVQTLVCVLCMGVVKFIAAMCIIGALVGLLVSVR
jgi:hypothetical protein